MKEKIFNNIIFVLFIVLLLVFSLKCFLVAFNIIKKDFLFSIIQNGLNLVYGSYINQAVLAAMGLILLFIALYLLWIKQKMIHQIPAVKISTEDGEINVSTDSLNNIILNVLENIAEVKEIKPSIKIIKNSEINTILDLVVTPNCNIPETAHYIQQKLKEELPKKSGINAKEVKINVSKIEY